MSVCMTGQPQEPIRGLARLHLPHNSIGRNLKASRLASAPAAADAFVCLCRAHLCAHTSFFPLPLTLFSCISHEHI